MLFFVGDLAHILQSLDGSNILENWATKQTNKQKKSGDLACILQSLDCSNILENQATEQTNKQKKSLYLSSSLYCSIKYEYCIVEI